MQRDALGQEGVGIVSSDIDTSETRRMDGQ